MSADQKNINPDEQQILEEQSSGLQYLQNNQLGQDESKESNIQNPKKRVRDWNEKDSQVRRVYINNRGKEKKVESDVMYDGIYLYKPGVELPSLYEFANKTIKIIIASEYIKRTNPEILKRNICGTDPYTSNSDAVCILVHSGYINIHTYLSKRYEGVELICKVIKPKKNYTGGFKNGLMSRNLKGYNGNALKPESVRNLSSLGQMELLEKYAANMHIPIGKNRIKPKPKNIANIIPIPQTHIVFNMNNEPAYKYSIFNIADKGFEKNEFLIKKLDNFILYLESEEGCKYELVKKSELDVFEVFKFSKVKHPDRIDNEYFTKNKSPLDDQQIQIIYPNLEWDQILWGNASILLRNQRRIDNLTSFKYYKREKDAK